MMPASAKQQATLEAPETHAQLEAGVGGRLADGGSCVHHVLVLEDQTFYEGLGYLQVLTCLSCHATIRRHRHVAEPDTTLF